MKIIYSDNIPDDTSSETLWLDDIPDSLQFSHIAQRVCDKLNESLGDRQGPFYRIVDNQHKLYKWEP